MPDVPGFVGTVKKAVQSFSRLAKAWGWSLTMTSRALVLEGFASDDGYRELGALLVRLIASAAAAGGSGRVMLVAYGDEEFAVEVIAIRSCVHVRKVEHAAAMKRIFPTALPSPAHQTEPAGADARLPSGPSAKLAAMMEPAGMFDSLPTKREVRARRRTA